MVEAIETVTLGPCQVPMMKFLNLQEKYHVMVHDGIHGRKSDDIYSRDTKNIQKFTEKSLRMYADNIDLPVCLSKCANRAPQHQTWRKGPL